jgi:hypothetical protein
MKKIVIIILAILIIPMALMAGLNFGLINTAKKRVDKVDEKVGVIKKAATTTIVSNRSPIIASIVANPTTLSTGAVSAITCSASDPDGDTLSYLWSAASGTISGAGSTINWTAPASSSTYVISVTVSDGHGASVQASTTVAATRGNIAPVITSVVPNPIAISTGEVSAITCTASDSDDDALTYMWSAASGTISGTGSTVNWTAPTSTGAYTLNVTVSDGHGGSVQASTVVVTSFWITYTTANGLPNNFVKSIAIDSLSNKWFGIFGYISKFDGATWTNYLTTLVADCVIIDGSGNKWFATAGGWS